MLTQREKSDQAQFCFFISLFFSLQFNSLAFLVFGLSQASEFLFFFFAEQIMIFPEGTCTNRSCLITFKPGNSSCTSPFPSQVKVAQQALMGSYSIKIVAELSCWWNWSYKTWPCSHVWHVFAGAFIPAVPVQPVVIRYPNTLVREFFLWKHVKCHKFSCLKSVLMCVDSNDLGCV